MVIATKIKPGENLTDAIFYRRKIPSLRYGTISFWVHCHCLSALSSIRWQCTGTILMTHPIRISHYRRYTRDFASIALRKQYDYRFRLRYLQMLAMNTDLLPCTAKKHAKNCRGNHGKLVVLSFELQQVNGKRVQVPGCDASRDTCTNLGDIIHRTEVVSIIFVYSLDCCRRWHG